MKRLLFHEEGQVRLWAGLSMAILVMIGMYGLIQIPAAQDFAVWLKQVMS